MEKQNILSIRRTSQYWTTIHLIISGPINSKSLGGILFAVHLILTRSMTSEVFPPSSKDMLTASVRTFLLHETNQYFARRSPVQVLCADNAAENISQELTSFRKSWGIATKTSQPYAPESNGLAERLIHGHWMRSMVRLVEAGLPNTLRAESLTRASWKRKRVPGSIIDDDIPRNR